MSADMLTIDVLQLEDTPKYALEGQIPGLSIITVSSVESFVKLIRTPIQVRLALVIDNRVPRWESQPKETRLFGMDMIRTAQNLGLDIPKFFYTSEPDEIPQDAQASLFRYNTKIVKKQGNKPLNFGLTDWPEPKIPGPELLTYLLQRLKDQ